ncbi:hypothetical protein F2Q69_00046727 [Brassica cretica]|uniref:Uncharacterized protein n=1 Tax=Brassica cretica TaxID=69181 RepID=A0A8S9PX82_BRACR|nr:hypothetical protein F2Q69_00046727 [Brassica cretica]
MEKERHRGRQGAPEQRSRKVTPLPPRDGRSMPTKDLKAAAFHERIDRHGNIFGARVETKQTRIPPPSKTLERQREEHLPWRGKMLESVPEPHSLSSPPYTKKRDPVSERDLQRRPPFPQRGLREWVLQERTEKQILNDLNEATMLYLNCPEPTEAAARRQRVLAGDARGQTEEAVARLMKQQGPPEAVERRGSPQLGQTPTIPSKEQVMRELQEVTKQYLSCIDPVEAVARRQRVLLGDAEGLLEKTAGECVSPDILAVYVYYGGEMLNVGVDGLSREAEASDLVLDMETP